MTREKMKKYTRVEHDIFACAISMCIVSRCLAVFKMPPERHLSIGFQKPRQTVKIALLIVLIGKTRIPNKTGVTHNAIPKLAAFKFCVQF